MGNAAVPNLKFIGCGALDVPLNGDIDVAGAAVLLKIDMVDGFEVAANPDCAAVMDGVAAVVGIAAVVGVAAVGEAAPKINFGGTAAADGLLKSDGVGAGVLAAPSEAALLEDGRVNGFNVAPKPEEATANFDIVSLVAAAVAVGGKATAADDAELPKLGFSVAPEALANGDTDQQQQQQQKRH